MGKQKSYESEGIVVHFDARRCIHAERCVHGLPSVFDAQKRPWIQPAEGSPEAIAEVIHRCPTGALTYDRTDGGPPEPTAETTTITEVRDGPLHVRGAVEVVSEDGRSFETRGRMALCRCGASKNKPYCDNSHLETGFEA